MSNKQKIKTALHLVESSPGTLSGGFVFLQFSETEKLFAGSEDANNCHGGNCVTGCGTNLSAGCGANTNTVAGCGSKALSANFSM